MTIYKDGTKTRNISTGYKPRRWQLWIHQVIMGLAVFNGMKKAYKQIVLVIHRRGGKTVLTVNHIIMSAFSFTKPRYHKDQDSGEMKLLINPEFAYVAPTYKQAKKIAWKIFKEYLKDIPNVRFVETDLTIFIKMPHPLDPKKTQTAIIYVMGAENHGAFRGMALDGAVLDEMANIPKVARTKSLKPALADRGGWEIIIGTPQGHNQFKEIYDEALENPDDWVSLKLPVSITKLIDQATLDSFRRTMGQKAYDQEFECDFDVEPDSKYFAETLKLMETEGKIHEMVRPNLNLPVKVYMDIGFNDANSLWFVQQIGNTISVIDYYQSSGKGAEHYIETMANKPYKYSELVLPHDGKVHDWGTGLARDEQVAIFCKQWGIWHPRLIRTIPRSKNKIDDINRARIFLLKCIINPKTTGYGFKCLENYSKVWDDKKEIFLESPYHDQYSNGADAFIYISKDYNDGKLGQNDDWEVSSESQYELAETSFKENTEYNPFEVEGFSGRGF